MYFPKRGSSILLPTILSILQSILPKIFSICGILGTTTVSIACSLPISLKEARPYRLSHYVSPSIVFRRVPSPWIHFKTVSQLVKPSFTSLSLDTNPLYILGFFFGCQSSFVIVDELTTAIKQFNLPFSPLTVSYDRYTDNVYLTGSGEYFFPV